jgi:hypothetical protein
MSNFREFGRATGFLLPPSLDEWLPERHLARFVVEVIDGSSLFLESEIKHMPPRAKSPAVAAWLRVAARYFGRPASGRSEGPHPDPTPILIRDTKGQCASWRGWR